MIKKKTSEKHFYFAPKLFYQSRSLYKRIRRYEIKHKGVKYPYKLHPVNVKTISRSSCILPICVGYSFLISNGRIFAHLFVSADILGYKFGEFCNTRRRFHFRKKKKKKNVK